MSAPDCGGALLLQAHLSAAGALMRRFSDRVTNSRVAQSLGPASCTKVQQQEVVEGPDQMCEEAAASLRLATRPCDDKLLLRGGESAKQVGPRRLIKKRA